MISYIEPQQEESGVEPISGTLQFAPSTFYADRNRPPRRRRGDEISPDYSPWPADLVDRVSPETARDQLWIADITYMATWSPFACMALVADMLAGQILGWRVANQLRAELALHRLDHAIWTRQSKNLQGYVHHSARGVQYLSNGHPKRLTEEGDITSTGARGDSCDDAVAESIIGPYKIELIAIGAPCKTVDSVELDDLTNVIARELS